MKRASSDLQLLRRARWDEEAFRALYRRYAEPLTSWLEREAGGRDIALEITAETFARALVRAGRLRGDAEHGAGPWLYAVAADLLARYWAGQAVETRYRRRLGVLEETHFRDEETLPVRVVLSSSTIALRLEAALDAMPVAYRDAVERRVLDARARGEASELPAGLDTARVHALRAFGLAVRRWRWL